MSYFKKYFSGGSLGSQMVIETDVGGDPIVSNSTGASSGPIEFLMGLQSDPSTTTIDGAFLKWLIGSMEINATLIKLYGSIDISTNYVDIGEIAVPSDPSADIRRLFVDTATGELSVRTAGGVTVSLEAVGGTLDHDNTYHTPDYHTESDGTGTVTVHSGVTDAGSGIIISDAERTALHAIYTLQQHNNSFHSTNYHTEADGTGVVTVHSDMTSVGSGAIITTGERSALHAKFTASEARSAINNIFGSDGKADKDIDLATWNLISLSLGTTTHILWDILNSGGSRRFRWNYNNSSIYLELLGRGTTVFMRAADSSGQIWFPQVYGDPLSGTYRDLFIKSDGQLLANASSRKFKMNIVPMEDTSWIYQLNCVNFNRRLNTWDETNEKRIQLETHDGLKAYGLIAEDVDEIPEAAALIARNDSGEPDSIVYSKLIPILLHAIQKLNIRITLLEDK